jgi:hypothetical protein
LGCACGFEITKASDTRNHVGSIETATWNTGDDIFDFGGFTSSVECDGKNPKRGDLASE